MANYRRTPTWYPNKEWTEVQLVGDPDGPFRAKEKGKPPYYKQACEVDGEEHVWWLSPREREAILGYEGKLISARKGNRGIEVSCDEEPEEEEPRERRRESDSRPRQPSRPSGPSYADTEAAFLTIRGRLTRQGIPEPDLQAATATMFLWWDRAGRPPIPGGSDISAKEDHEREGDDPPDEDDIPF